MPNLIIETGNLGDDPKMFYSTDGNPIANFDLAFRCGKDKTGWIKVTCFGKTAETAEKYLHKGARIIVTGYLDQESWETESGSKRTTIKIIANSIEFVKVDGQSDEAPY